MYPYIKTTLGDLSTFTLLICVGVLVMILMIHHILKKMNQTDEEVIIFPRLVICGIVGYSFAAIADFIFKYIKYGVLKIYGITFYGGLIGGIVALFLLLKFNSKSTNISVQKWFEILTLPFIIFHFFGRIGCFLGGCCYGKNTQSFLGVVFPDNEKMGIIHNGSKCYPTQLFEAIALIGIFIIVYKSKHRFSTYMLSYAVMRFFLEFLRGDDRGMITLFLSPSQVISLCVICSFGVYKLILFCKTKKSVDEDCILDD